MYIGTEQIGEMWLLQALLSKNTRAGESTSNGIVFPPAASLMEVVRQQPTGGGGGEGREGKG